MRAYPSLPCMEVLKLSKVVHKYLNLYESFCIFLVWQKKVATHRRRITLYEFSDSAMAYLAQSVYTEYGKQVPNTAADTQTEEYIFKWKMTQKGM